MAAACAATNFDNKETCKVCADEPLSENGRQMFEDEDDHMTATGRGARRSSSVDFMLMSPKHFDPTHR
ncbi:unnamed protein product [Heligmosomoides polygyrus]|uniref:RanBP2-type domain-containing protein n=1 Tax=Heligmosomoides polygyrus TaxID=6339 RepID=A0A183GE39_HELPZ|nr:unnamed protein product [Heligmosomoides polygyrus]